MDAVKALTSEVVNFGRDVTSAFNNLSLGSRVLIGGAVGAYILKQYGQSVAISLMFIPSAVVAKLKKKKKKDYKNGVIYLHMFARSYGKKVPNLSPFVVKLECWLRLNNIKHEVVETRETSKSTGQIPYIIYNGKEYADSELIMDFLQKELNIKDEPLSPAEMGIQRAIISMLDEKFAFNYFLYRYTYAAGGFSRFCLFDGLPPFLMRYFMKTVVPKMMLQRASAQGIGRKPRDVVISIGNQDLKAVSLYLGDKKFLTGDKITRADCCAFAHLSQVFYVDLPYPFTEFMRRECPNLEPYINRIKAELYPDWTSIVDDSEF